MPGHCSVDMQQVLMYSIAIYRSILPGATKMKWIITTLLATMLAGSSFAGTTPEKTPDARLDAKVSLNVTHAKLQDVLKTLTDETKVVIEAGGDDRDWRVKERRVTIHAKDISLRLLLDEIPNFLATGLPGVAKKASGHTCTGRTRSHATLKARCSLPSARKAYSAFANFARAHLILLRRRSE